MMNFNFCAYRLTVEAQERIELPRLNNGITLRGAFGSVFRSIVCHDRDEECGKCRLHSSCPYGFIFTPMVPPDAERLRLNRDIPRPFVIKPPLDESGAYQQGDTLAFGLVVVGKAMDFLPYFIVTFEEMGRRGIGVGRGRFRMKGLESLKTSGGWDKVFRAEDRLVRPPRESLAADGLVKSGDSARQRLSLSFLTPVLLKEKGKWVAPHFSPLMKRLRDRINSLSYFYCGEALDLDFRGLGEAAERVRTSRDDLQWMEERRFSRHRNLDHLLKGYMGMIEFEGELGPFMPFLRLGEFLHVGKATAFGQGWYRIMD